MPTTHVPRHPTLLLILDGVGIAPPSDNNAVSLARTPNLDNWLQQHAHTTLDASGRQVGLPEGQMGNSEVGHMTIGCGSILRQDLVRIDDAIQNHSFYENPTLLAAVRSARQRQRPLHLVGLVSDGGVHSHINHLLALIELCRRQQVRPVVHAITDGRDTPPKSAQTFLRQVEQALQGSGGVISTLSGRYYAMDRDKRWERTRAAWRAMCFGEGPRANDALALINQAYGDNITDEFIPPTVLAGGEPIQGDDAVVFFNFRNDRARQLTYVLAGRDFKPFDRGAYQPLSLTCLTEYDPKLDLPIAFPPEFPQTTLAKVVSDAGIAQFHCAETEKYAHVTFFLNGGLEEPYPGESRLMVPSPEVATYDLAPAMSAHEVADALIECMQAGQHGFVVANFANGDMVGHTAVRGAVIEALEVLDAEVGRVVDCACQQGFSVVMTADHGNSDQLVDPETGQPHTQHTTNPVPCVVIDEEVQRLSSGGGLSNLAPTVLELMGLPRPEAMTSSSLIENQLEFFRRKIA